MISVAALEDAHSQARDAHQAAVLREAERICFQELTNSPNQALREAFVFHVRGLLAARQRQHEFALACMTRAAALDTATAAYQGHVAELLARMGRSQHAIAAFQRVIALDSSDPRWHRGLARAFFREQRYEDATASFDTALRIDSAHAQTHDDLGDLLQAQGRYQEACARYELSIQLRPQRAGGYARLGRARLAVGDVAGAADIFNHGARRCRDRADLQAGLGEAQLRLGAAEAAVVSCRDALATRPLQIHASRLLVLALERLGRHVEAAGAWFSLGEAYENSGRLEEAQAAYRQSVTRKPNHLKAHLGLGYLQLQIGKPAGAIAHFDAALKIRPDHVHARLGRGRAAALVGDLERHWDAIRWFDRNGPWRRRYCEQPEWDGRRLEGQRILIWANSTVPHTLRMIRFARLVKERGAHVIVESHRSLVSLVGSSPGVDAAVARRLPLPRFDVYALLTSLPSVFRTRLSTIPAHVPYLAVDPVIADRWCARLGSGNETTVGLLWASELDDRREATRSVPLVAFEPLARIDRVRVISLQGWPQIAELVAPPPGLRVERVLDDSPTLDDLAGLLCQLDLVITVDSKVAHLAGALGIPVWTLVPYAPDWHWHEEAGHSPWYPSMRLFRQTARGDWSGAIEQVRTALVEGVTGSRPLASSTGPGSARLERHDRVSNTRPCRLGSMPTVSNSPTSLLSAAETNGEGSRIRHYARPGLRKLGALPTLTDVRHTVAVDDADPPQEPTSVLELE